MSAGAPAIPAPGPFSGSHAPPIGQLRVARRPNRPQSGPLRAFQPQGHTPAGYPPETPEAPVNAVSKRRWLRALRECRRSPRARPGCFAAVAWTSNRRPTQSVVTLLLRTVYRCPPQSRRSSSSLLGQERQHERRRTRDPGSRTLFGQSCTANRPTAGRAASESAS